MSNLISIVDENGHERFLGNNPAPLMATWGVYGDVPETPMVSESKWLGYFDPATSFDDQWLSPVHDQDGIGQCNCEAVTEAIEDARAMAQLPYVQLSAADLYNRINGGRDNGSTLEDGMRVAMASGVGTAATCGTTIWKRGMKQASAEERGKYKVLQAWLCPEFEHVMSAVLCGFRVVTGLSWYGNFNTDSDGWLPTSGRGSAGGHAITAYGPAYRNNMFGVWERQSWGAWGYQKKGRFVAPRTLFGHSIGGHWALRVVVSEAGNVPVPKFAT